ncbi:MAG: methyltransferase domain-containing protein [Sarcina sp.]
MKNDIEKKFSKGSKTYDENANVQKEMINTLINQLPRKNFQKILEIGTGTGLLTTKLIELFPSANITTIDISSEMIIIAKNKVNNNPSITFIHADIEEFCPIEEFDLIISSATLQWISNLCDLLETLKNRLAVDGVLAFATFTDGTFKELDNSLNFAFTKNNISVNQNRNYYSIESLKEIIHSTFKNFEFKQISHLSYIEYFKNALSFLKAIKAIGANSNILSQYITPYVTKDLLDYYDKNYSFSETTSKEYAGFVRATYYLAFVIIE